MRNKLRIWRVCQLKDAHFQGSVVGAVPMIRPNPRFPWLSALRPSSLLLPLFGVACASGSAQMNVGTSMDRSADENDLDDPEDDGLAETRTDGPAFGEPEAAEAADPVEVYEELKAEREALEAELARAALHSAPPPGNPLGLVMAVSERTSDLSWILAIENRSSAAVKLAALPNLLRAKITPPAATAPESEATSTAPGAEAKPPESKVCEGKPMPTSLTEDDTLELAPGQLLIHAFDPRDLCEGTNALTEGASVEVSYGFPLQTKKLWKGGKLTTVEVEQTAPFVAERIAQGEEAFVPLKFLTADPIRLDQTYPLEAVSALPSDEDSLADDGENKPRTPPPPLDLRIFPLGTSSAPEQGVVTVELRNTSGKSMEIFIRRELFTYEVSGPLGEATCHMYPAERAPDASAFTTLAPGEARSLSTRLAEACPEGTWDEPGTYSVSASFQTTADGAEHEIDAFMGSAVTKSPARLVVPGADPMGERGMRVAPK